MSDESPTCTLLLAPMQEVTTLPFWQVLHPRGGADIYVTEYFRVYETSRLEEHILASVTANPTGQPVIAQMIGNHPDYLVRAATQLQAHPIAGIDLNLGCPSPTVCGKSCGGALLKSPERVREIILRLRDVTEGKLSIKTRVGVDSHKEFQDWLPMFASLPIDSFALHGRTVKEKYLSAVHTDEIAQAVREMPCPVYANGSVISVDTAQAMLRKTNPAGLMIGRGAIRNPWLFTQIRQALAGEPIERPTLADLHEYVCDLYEATGTFGKTVRGKYDENKHVQSMKRFLSYIGAGISDGQFLYDVRRTSTEVDFMRVCWEHLGNTSLMDAEPEDESRHFMGFRELSS